MLYSVGNLQKKILGSDQVQQCFTSVYGSVQWEGGFQDEGWVCTSCPGPVSAHPLQ